MKALVPLLSLLFAAEAFAETPGGRLAFERDTAVWVALLDGSQPKKIAAGQAPELSPDGTRLAFNTVQATGQPAHRKIAVADLATGKTIIFNEVPSDNCLQPLWSPDGRRLLFYQYVQGEMRLAVINADGSGFRDLQASGKPYHSYWGAAWAADGASLYGEDMESLYHLDLEMKVLQQWKIEKLVPQGGMGGDVRLHASADGKTLLMDVEMAEKERKDWAGPPPAIWTLDLATEKVTRLTPPRLYAWDAHWLDAGNILFSSQTPKETESSIYRMSVTGQGKDAKLLVRKARLASAAP